MRSPLFLRRPQNLLMENDPFIQIYSQSGNTYHEMISVEDIDQNLKPALQSITNFDNKNILDLGSGTGRIPLYFPQHKITSLDLHASMLDENRKQKERVQGNWNIIQANMVALPLKPQHFNIITVGWAMGHFTGWYPTEWQHQMQRVFNQIDHVLAPGGCLIILETLSTGSLVPTPPSPGLAAYYIWLETTHQFRRIQIQTDYLFPSLEEAIKYTKFFFGEDLAKKVRQNQWVRLPEWTGIWIKFKNRENLI